MPWFYQCRRRLFCQESRKILEFIMDENKKEEWRQLGLLICDICHFRTSDQGTFQTHICRKKKIPCDSGTKNVTVNYNSHTRKFVCCCCRFVADENEFMEHLQEHLVHNPFWCDICEEGFQTKIVIQQHYKEKHNAVKRISITLRVSPLSKEIVGDVRKNGQASFQSVNESYTENQGAYLRNENIQTVKMTAKTFTNLSHCPVSTQNQNTRKTCSKSVPSFPIISAQTGNAYQDKKDSFSDVQENMKKSYNCSIIPVLTHVTNNNAVSSQYEQKRQLANLQSSFKLTSSTISANKAYTEQNNNTLFDSTFVGSRKNTAISTQNQKVQSQFLSTSTSKSTLVPTVSTQNCDMYHSKDKEITHHTSNMERTNVVFKEKGSHFGNTISVNIAHLPCTSSDATPFSNIPQSAFNCIASTPHPYSSASQCVVSEHRATCVNSAVPSFENIKYQQDMISSERQSFATAKHIEKGSLVDKDSPLSIVKLECVDNSSYWYFVKDTGYCRKCALQFSNCNLFYQHIHNHIHPLDQRICPSECWLDCSRLQDAIADIDRACGGQLKQMDTSVFTEQRLSVVKQEPNVCENSLDDASISQECHNVSNMIRDIDLRPSDDLRRNSCEEILKEDDMNKCHREDCAPSPNYIKSTETGCITKNDTNESFELIENELEKYYHVLSHVPKNFYKCCFPNCGFSNQESLELLMHTEEKHGNETEFCCIYCGYVGTAVTEFVDHINVHNDNRIQQYSCSIVKDDIVVDSISNPKLGGLMSSLEVKSKRHDACSFQCNACDIRFSSQSKLKNHFNYSALKTFGCRLCRSTFLDSKSFHSHSTAIHPGHAKLQRVNFNFLCQFRKQNFLSFLKLLRLQVTTHNTTPLRTETDGSCSDSDPVSACFKSTISPSSNGAPIISSSNTPSSVSTPLSDGRSLLPTSVSDVTMSSSLLHLNNSTLVTPVSNLIESCDDEGSSLETNSSKSTSPRLLNPTVLTPRPSISEALPMLSSSKVAIQAHMLNKLSRSEFTEGQLVCSSTEDFPVCLDSSSSSKPNLCFGTASTLLNHSLTVTSSIPCLIESTSSMNPMVASISESKTCTSHCAPRVCHSSELSMAKIAHFSQSKSPTSSSSDPKMEMITESKFNKSPAVSSFLSSSRLRAMFSTSYYEDSKRESCSHEEGNERKKQKSELAHSESGDIDTTQLPDIPFGEGLTSLPRSLPSYSSIIASKITPLHTVTKRGTSASSQLLTPCVLNPLPCPTATTVSTKADSLDVETRNTSSPDTFHVCDDGDEPGLVIDMDTTCPGIHNDMFLPRSHFESAVEDDKENEKDTLLYQCKLCSFDCVWNEGKMADHIANRHKYVACGYCDNPYYDLRQLKNHIKYQHGNASFKSKDLGKEHFFSVFSSCNEVKYKSSIEKKKMLQGSRQSVRILVVNNDPTVTGSEGMKTENETTIEPIIEEIIVHKDVLSAAQISDFNSSKLDYDSIKGEKCLSSKEKKAAPFRCRRCSFHFSSLREVERHSYREHKQAKVKWIDHVTGCIYTQSCRYLKGNLSELPTKPYLCRLCSYRSKSRSGVQNHLSDFHPDYTKGHAVLKLHGFSSAIRKPVALLHDGLNHSTEATSHDVKGISSRKGKAPSCFNCHLCHAKLSTEFFLRIHLAKHKGFRYKSTLSTSDGLLICSRCNYIAKSNVDLANHVATHAMDRRYKCSLCDEESHQKKSINYHILKQHGQDGDATVHDRDKMRGLMKLQVVNLHPIVLLKRLRSKEIKRWL